MGKGVRREWEELGKEKDYDQSRHKKHLIKKRVPP